MGTKGLIRLLIVLAVAGGLALIAKFVGSDSGVSTVESKSTNKRTKVFGEFPANDVRAISIQGKEKTLNFKNEEGEWVIQNRENFPANADRIRDLIRQMWDIRITQVVPNGGAHIDRLELTPPDKAEGDAAAATVISFKDGEGNGLASISLGKILETSDGRPNPYTGGVMKNATGRYVQPGGSNSVYLIDTPLEEAADTDPASWMQSDFFNVNQIQTIALETGDAKEDWKLVRDAETEDFKLEGLKDGEALESSAISFAKSAFRSASFDDIYVGDDKPKSDSATWMVTTFDGLTYTISVGEKDDLNNRPMTFAVEGKFKEMPKAEEGETDEQKTAREKSYADEKAAFEEKLTNEQKLSKDRVYKIRSSTIDSYLKKRTEFLVPPPEPETPGIQIPSLEDPANAPVIPVPEPPATETPKPAKDEDKAAGEADKPAEEKEAKDDPKPSADEPKSE